MGEWLKIWFGLGVAFYAVVALALSVSAQVKADGAGAAPKASALSPSEAMMRQRAYVEIDRLKMLRADCVAQGREAEVGGQAGITNSRIPEAAAFSRVVREKVDCIDQVDAEIARLQALLSTENGVLDAAGDRFTHEYQNGLKALLQWLPRAAMIIKNPPETLTYEVFAQQTQQLDKSVQALKNRYIRLIATGVDRDLAKNVFEATDTLCASSLTWSDQVKAERQMSALEAAGPSTALPV